MGLNGLRKDTFSGLRTEQIWIAVIVLTRLASS